MPFFLSNPVQKPHYSPKKTSQIIFENAELDMLGAYDIFTMVNALSSAESEKIRRKEQDERVLLVKTLTGTIRRQ